MTLLAAYENTMLLYKVASQAQSCRQPELKVQQTSRLQVQIQVTAHIHT